MKILKRNIKRCKECKRLRGYVMEKYNGKVPVFCTCDLRDPKNHPFPIPSMISRSNDLLTWTPISDHKEKDGERWRMVAHIIFFWLWILVFNLLI